MEARSMQVYYASYNSIINDGRRVRRMRRTELSAQKIKSSSCKKTQTFNTLSKQKSVPRQSSLAKVEPRRNKQKNEINKKVAQSAQNEYYNDYNDCVGKHEVRHISAPREYSRSREKHQISNSKYKQEFSRQSPNRKSKEQSPNNSMGRNSKQNKKNINELPYYTQESKNSKTSNINSSRSRKSVEKLSPNIPIGVQQNSQIQPNYNDQSKQINKSANNSVSRKSQKKSYIRSQIKKSNAELKHSQDLDQYGFKQQRNSKDVNSKMKNSATNSKINQNSNIKSKESKSHISHSAKLQVRKESQKNQDKKITNQPSAFKEVDEIFSKEISNVVEQPSNISKVKLDQLVNPIINSSSAKKQSWKEAIKSLTDLESQVHEERSQSQNQNTRNAFQSKKLSLQIDSMRQDNISTENKLESSQKNTWRNLPLSSRDPSRKSFESFGSKVQPGSLKSVLDCIEIHQFLISLINQFKEETLKYEEQTPDTQMLCFLLEKKHFLQKSNLIKALKGGKNIFRLSANEIQTDVLKKYLQSEQILKIVRQYEMENRQLFKNLEKKYLQLKPRLKSNPYFKLETPNDSFSKEIVRILEIELDTLSQKLKNNPDEEQEELIEHRILSLMEMVFLLSEFSGRNVKKIQFYEEIEDFEDYYAQNQQALVQTFQYFKNFK